MAEIPTISDGRLIYTKLENGLMVGKNLTVYATGAVEGTKISGTLVIPDSYQSWPVIEIGQYAFTNCTLLRHIVLGNNVKVVHKYALGDLPFIETITIPSSLEVIYHRGFYFFCARKIDHGERTGHTRIYFQENSQLKFLDEAFSYQKYVSVYTPSIITPICKTNPFTDVIRTYLYSPHSFNFCNTRFSNSATCINKLFSSKILNLFIFLLVTK